MVEGSAASTATPLLTAPVCAQLEAARQAGAVGVDCSLDLQRSLVRVGIADAHWSWRGQHFPYFERCKERSVYFWGDGEFRQAARYSAALVKLVPTPWGAPTFEIDGIKMLPSAQLSPFEDARRKVASIEPAGKAVLDTCGGLGYFAHWCIEAGAARIHSFEKNADVIWLRGINPWSPTPAPSLEFQQGDVSAAIARFPDAVFGAALHDPPRFSIAGELYSEEFYRQLARTLRRSARLFHYTGSPQKFSRGRDLAAEVMRRLERVGFSATSVGDGVLAVKR